MNIFGDLKCENICSFMVKLTLIPIGSLGINWHNCIKKKLIRIIMVSF